MAQDGGKDVLMSTNEASQQSPLDRLLAALDSDRDFAGRQYRDLHTRLTGFFAWQNNVRPEERADEVMDRVMRRLDDGKQIDSVPAFAFGVARLLLFEARKQVEREIAAHTQLLVLIGEPVELPQETEGESAEELCFEDCLALLTPANRELILTYYSGEGGAKIEARRMLASRLGTDLNALRVRAHRIRVQLESCARQCAESAM
jgi:DNA-directed RNA polymerase specialized sigma24 family protein